VPKVPKRRKRKSGKEHTGKGNLGRSRSQETEDTDSDDRREQSIGGDCAGLGTIIKTSQTHRDDTSVWTLSESVSGWCETVENHCCRFFCVEICPNTKVTRLGYSKQAVTQKLVRQGEYIHRDPSHTKEGIRLIRMMKGPTSPRIVTSQEHSKYTGMCPTVLSIYSFINIQIT
jgi:hypothetical protein